MELILHSPLSAKVALRRAVEDSCDSLSVLCDIHVSVAAHSTRYVFLRRVKQKIMS